MALILNIDTSGQSASVCLSKNLDILAFTQTDVQKEQAAFLHPTIKEVLTTAGHVLNEIDAVAFTGGPGSYTGLRVGMAAAKGLCFALNKPLINVSTLLVMCQAALKSITKEGIGSQILLCPMIDARRMEVFTGLYTLQLQIVLEPLAFLLEKNSFDSWLNTTEIIFFGDGSTKYKQLISNNNASFLNVEYSALDLTVLAFIAWQQRNFADVTYCEPDYLKPFHLNK